MNPFAPLFKSYVRWRHSRGFGVHSPFAYDLVKMAIRPGDAYGFYGYSDIDDVVLDPDFRGYPQSRHDARLLLRLLVQLSTRRLLLPRGLTAMEAAALSAGVPVVNYESQVFPPVPTPLPSSLPAPEPGDMIVAHPIFIGESELSKRLREGSTIFAMAPTEAYLKALYEACDGHGLIFHGERLILVVPRKEMAFVAYTMKF